MLRLHIERSVSSLRGRHLQRHIQTRKHAFEVHHRAQSQTQYFKMHKVFAQANVQKRFKSNLDVYGESTKADQVSLKEKLINYVKNNKTGVKAGGAVLGTAMTVFLGIGNVVKLVGLGISLPVAFVMKLFLQHLFAKAEILEVVKEKLTTYRREMETLVGPFDLNSNDMIHIHSSEHYKTKNGRLTRALMGIVKVNGAYGTATGKIISIREDDVWVTKAFDVEYINFKMGTQGVHQFIQPDSSIESIFNLPPQKETGRQTNFDFKKGENNLFNSPLIAMAKVSFWMQKRKEKKEDANSE